MKRLILSLVLCLLLSPPALACEEDACRDDIGQLAWMPPYIAGAGVSGGVCVTSYDNTGGTGNRSGIITGSSDADGQALFLAGTIAGLFDGVNNSGVEYFRSVSLNSAVFMKFDFGDGHTPVINEARWYQSDTSAHGTWKWQGSNNDSNWYDIGDSFSLGGEATQTITALSGNTEKYRYYKMIGVSGSTSITPYTYEIEFKICDY